MSFKDAKIEAGNSLFLTLKDGINRIRIVSEEVVVWKAYAERKCVGIYTNPQEAHAYNAKQRFNFWVIDRADNQMHILDAGPAIIGPIKDLANDADYGFDTVPNYDIKITKRGSGLDTEYSVLNSPPIALTPEEVAMINKTIAEKGTIAQIIENDKAKFNSAPGGEQEIRIENMPF